MSSEIHVINKSVNRMIQKFNKNRESVNVTPLVFQIKCAIIIVVIKVNTRLQP